MESLNKTNNMAAHVESYLAQIELDDLEADVDSYAATPILDAKYKNRYRGSSRGRM